MRRLNGAVAGVMIGGIALTACGSHPQPMTANARQELRADVVAIERAAAAHQLGASTTALAHLQSDIAQLEATGKLTTTAGTSVLRAAAAVQADIALVTTNDHHDHDHDHDDDNNDDDDSVGTRTRVRPR